MAQLNHIELQTLRSLIGSHDTASEKLGMYAQQSADPQVKAYFQKSAQGASQTKQKLMGFLTS
ncbi:MAG: hypothetical protein LBR54_00840 [Oscillospiraceae bacterium]|nr:hypothetical protein [Oscillospiraceae bacterium]